MMRADFASALERARAASMALEASPARKRALEREERATLLDARRRRIGAELCRITEEDARRIVLDRLDSEAWRAVKAWLETCSAFLVLRGARGSGKTVAAVGAIASRGGRVMTASEVVRAWRNEHAEAQELRRLALYTGFLVLDDLGTEPASEAASAAVQSLVDARQGARRTLITTNLSRADLEARYDARTVDRIDHQGVWVSLRTASLRTRSL